MAEPVLLVEQIDESITVLTLNRPEKRNALSIELTEMLAEAVRVAGADRGRRALIVMGAGPVFCAGLDLRQASDPANSERSAKALGQAYLELCRSPLITIAAAQGAAIGGGAGLLAACDLAIAADNLRIGFPEVQRGLVAGLVTALFRRQLGERTMRALVLLGKEISAARAVELGIVEEAVVASRLKEEAIELARQACEGAPGAVVRTKRLLDDLSARPIERDLQRAMQDHLEARNSEEAKEGIAAFLGKRKPRWAARRGDI